MVLEISKLVQDVTDTIPILVETLVTTINTSLFRIMVGVVAITHSLLPKRHTQESLILNVT